MCSYGIKVKLYYVEKQIRSQNSTFCAWCQDTFYLIFALKNKPLNHITIMRTLCIFVLSLLISANANAARWNKETTDWSANPHPQIGDWGFDRPGYPKGLYIHGVTVKEGKRVKNPLIYDNDVYDNVFDDEWMFAMAARNKLNLAAVIITPVLTDFWGFFKPEWISTAFTSRDIAWNSSRNPYSLPAIKVGYWGLNEQDQSHNIKSEGAQAYVDIINEQYRKNPDCPVIINIGGQGATLASAYCIDPSIAEKCIVYYTNLRVYNGHYRWASELIAKNFRVVSWGEDNWWMHKKKQNEWNVLPCPDHAKAKDNDAHSGEWALLTDMNQPMLNHMVYQFQHRSEYSNDEKASYFDAYGDGTFIHAWLPSIFSDAELRIVRGGEVLHITKFNAENKAAVKKITMQCLLNKKAYKKVKNN